MSPQTVATLVKAIESKDSSTAAHTWRVVLYARAMAEEAGLDRETIGRLTTAAALHDVGKLDISAAILKKPGKLTDQEFDAVKKHTVKGYDRLIARGETDEVILSVVRHHHERPDGLGYPDGLKGEAIPVVARFFAVIDSFDALTSIRPYRKEIGRDAAERAVAEIGAGVGTRYASDAFRTFEKLYRSGALYWILSYYNDACPLPDLTQSFHTVPGTVPMPVPAAPSGER